MPKVVMLRRPFLLHSAQHPILISAIIPDLKEMTPLICSGTASCLSGDGDATAQYMSLGSAATHVDHDRGKYRHW
jgi:hypothetical protein